ncbi:hypothetical protein [Klebsiella variicola]|uniref:hypothetical protein n=1 Tax=Klebsiella variicola TaxID=244366 RepID=UPI0034A31713
MSGIKSWLFPLLLLVATLALLVYEARVKPSREAQAREERAALIRAVSTASAEALETKLGELKANEIHTERIIHTETIKPVFSTVCASDEYVRLLNESIRRAGRTLSGQPAGDVPGGPSGADGADRP